MVPSRFAAAAVLLLAGCNNQVSLQLAASGALDAQQARLAVTRVQLTEEGGNVVTFDSADAGVKNLMGFRGGATVTLVSGGDLPQGHYVGLALTFDPDSAEVVNDAGTFPVDVPATPTATAIDVSVNRSDSVPLWAGLDLRLSLSDQTASTGRWRLDPRLNPVDLDHDAALSGTIAQAVKESSACLQGRTDADGAAVYAYPQANLAPYDDSPAASPHPTGTVAVTWNADGTGRYAFPHLRAGAYTIALNCVASADDPAVAQGQVFAAADNALLSEGEAATLDFQ